ncbi:MAG: glycosyltransferase family 4 protein [Anaerolineae bacterium]|nr:glycosyltransferase family 4 protein [Anaerolineae bacterium]
MRIALVTSWPTKVSGGSGTAVFFNAFIHALHACNYDVEIIAPNFDISDYVEVTLKRFLFNTELRTDPRVHAADVVIGFDYDGYGLDVRSSPPLLTSVHAIYGDVLQWETDPIRTMVQAQAFFDRVAMEKAVRVTVGSQYGKDRIAALYGIPPEKITVIPHGMFDPPWLALADALPPVRNDHPIILSVGKMYPRKRIDVLLRALATLRDKYPTVELRAAGDGLEWDRMKRLAVELGVDGNVTWLGHVASDADFAREWWQADVFCHPSSQETFGYVYLEAMCLGKPIVAVRAGAAPEVLGDAALLAESENPAALAQSLDQFLSDAALRQQYEQRARERSVRYTLQRMTEGYTRVIEEVAVGSVSRR